ncbi:DUF6210 family protein [Hahella sp. NBU794]|uniref:DUF6210 family protein n=1 Tax=Hahella sp. NBU794 TaxID=3422590 RepID=UPI003D6ECF0D
MNKPKIFLDPDGTNVGYLGVIVEHPTGVIYQQQCGGTDCCLMEMEGYYIPVGGAGNEGLSVDVDELTRVFHRGNSCWAGGEPCGRWPTLLDSERLKKLESIVGSIPIWSNEKGSRESTRNLLKIHYADEYRRERQIMEAWVPVETPNGVGVLVWSNCD